jgi:acid phosphatase type 7
MKKSAPPKKAPPKGTVIDAAALQASRKHHPSPAAGHSFGGDRLPSGFQTIIDPQKNPPQPFRALPAPTGAAPYRLSLDSVISADAIKLIESSGQMVFHAVGDTGGVNTPTYEENVANYMEADFSGNDPSTHPSFFYHLGDVVYYDGELANYFPEFYEPYANYPGPVFAIPGNHDGDIDPQTKESSLEGFVRNFCSQVPGHTPEGRDAVRTTMIQPNVYWTLLTPLVTFVGLYSNCPEGGQLSQTQIDWLQSELKAAPEDRALIVAVHHPIYSAYGSKPGSQHLWGVLDSAATTTGRLPDLVLSGHVHDYQRFTGVLNGKNVPMIVAGAGGYNKQLHTLAKIFHTSKLPITMKGSTGQLENFNDSQHGYLRITVTKKRLVCEYVVVPDTSTPKPGPLKAFDTLTIKTPQYA